MTYLATFLFPLFGVMLFYWLPLVSAIAGTMISGYLLLPSAFSINLPGLPGFDRKAVPVLTALILAYVFSRHPLQRARRDGTVPATGVEGVLPGAFPMLAGTTVFAGMLVVGPFFNWVTNTGPLVVADVVRQGLGPRDAISTAVNSAMAVLPLILGWKYMGSEQAQRQLLLVLAVSGLAYSIPTMIELRLAPQLHIWVYGYFQHEWIQHVRGGGYRPIVFLEHGLRLSLFLACAAMAVIALLRAVDGDRRALYFLAAIWLTLVVVLTKSLGMALIAAVLVPVLLLFGPRFQIFVAAAIAAAVLLYPATRAAGYSPLSPVVQAASTFAPGRAGSLEYRLETEARVVEHANAKPLFGWGGWNRAEVYSEEGYDITIRDGLWLIILGQAGWVGFIGVFGLLTCGIFGFFAVMWRRRPSLATSGICLILAANLMDLIPNSGLTPITWLMAGSLLGRLQLMAQSEAPRDAAKEARQARPMRQRAGRRGTLGLAGASDAIVASDTGADPSAPEPAGATGRYSRYAPQHVRRRRA